MIAYGQRTGSTQNKECLEGGGEGEGEGGGKGGGGGGGEEPDPFVETALHCMPQSKNKGS